MINSDWGRGMPLIGVARGPVISHGEDKHSGPNCLSPIGRPKAQIDRDRAYRVIEISRAVAADDKHTPPPPNGIILMNIDHSGGMHVYI